MICVGKVRVRDYDRQDGTHVRNHTREHPSSSDVLGELPPEEQAEHPENEAGDRSDQDKGAGL